MTDRPPMPARLRFEVFKRDKFTCQYCGAQAPDVILHADHVRPVADGGPTDILNLVTSCAKCNGGKGAIPLSSSAAFDKQRAQLGDLEERRQQIEMMLQWRDEIQGLAISEVDAVADRIMERSGFGMTETGRANIKRWLKKYSLALTLRAVDESFDTYLAFDAASNDTPTHESAERSIQKIPAVANILRQEVEKPYLRKIFYINGIFKRKLYKPNLSWIGYLEHLHVCGIDLDDMETDAKRMRPADFTKAYDEWLKSIGKEW